MAGSPDLTGAQTTQVQSHETPPARLSWWERLSFGATHAAAAALLAVVSLRGLYLCGSWFGTIEWLVNYKRRRRFARALSRVLGARPPGPVRRKLTREFFARSRCDRMFYLVLDRIPRDVARGLLEITNQSMLDDAVARGRGAYVAMSHHGPHHVMAMLLAISGYKTLAVRDRNEGPLRRYVQQRFDERYPAVARTRWLFADSYPRDIYRCLQEGYIVGSAMDVAKVRHATQRTEEVTIFGEPRRFLSGPLRVAFRCRAPVFQGFIRSEPNFRYRLDLVEVLLDPDEETEEERAVAAAMATYAANVEEQIRRFPALLSRV